MIADRVRMDAYREALARSIKPGDVVLDLGAGTGIMSLLACKLGAGKVHAVEHSDALVVARELAQANGCADRIEFHQSSSFDVRLFRPADVLVSDLRGVLPLHGNHVPSIMDARRRLLAPSGAQIPWQDTIRAQLVADAGLHAETLKVWKDGAFGLDLAPALRWAAHQFRKANLAQSRLVGQAQSVIKLDYRTIESPNARGEAHWIIDRDETVHGLGVWFDTALVDDIGFSNAPGRPRAIYGQMFFPFVEPLVLKHGEHVDVKLGATQVGRDYVWQWDTSVSDHGGSVRVALKQSSFQASPVNPARLGPRAAGHVPEPSAEGRAAARALALIEERKPIEAIAAQLQSEFPGLFAAAPGDAFELVADLSEWFSA
jgi:protein arginine N-methyltransferase 1